MRTAFVKRNYMVYFPRRSMAVILKAVLAQRVPLDIQFANLAPIAVISPGSFRVTAEPLVLLPVRLCVFRAEALRGQHPAARRVTFVQCFGWHD